MALLLVSALMILVFVLSAEPLDKRKTTRYGESFYCFYLPATQVILNSMAKFIIQPTLFPMKGKVTILLNGLDKYHTRIPFPG